MARIAGVDLPRRKHIAYALPYLFGIGHASRARSARRRASPDQEDGRAHRAEVKTIREHPRRRLQGRGRSPPRGPDEHQASDGPRLLPRPPSPPGSAGQRPAHAHQRAHPQGPAQGHPARARQPRRRRLSEELQAAQATDENPDRPLAAGTAKTGPKAKPEEEGQEEHRDRASRTSSRPSTTPSSRSPTSTATPCRGRAPASRGFKGSRKRRRSPRSSPPKRPRAARMEHGMRSVAVFVKGPGAGRESALRALQTAGLQGHAHPRRDAGSPQRLPSAQAPPRLTSLRSAKRDRHGSLHWSRLQALPPRRHEALPQGRALLHREVRVHPPSVPAGPARPGRASSSASTRCACARSRRCGASTACSSASSAATLRTRAAARAAPARRCSALLERRLDNVVHRLGFAHSRAEARQLVRHGHVLVNGKRVDIPSYLVQRRRQGRDPREEPQDQASSRRRSRSAEKRPVALVARARQGELRRHRQGPAGPRGAERAGDPRAATSSSTTRAKLGHRPSRPAYGARFAARCTRAGGGRRWRAGSTARRDRRANLREKREA